MRLRKGCGGRPPGPLKPLTADQRALAETCLALAMQLGLGYGERFGRLDDEWVSVAYEGLVNAAASFDPARGVKFSVWAWNKIRFALRDHHRQVGKRLAVQDFTALGELAEIDEPDAGGPPPEFRLEFQDELNHTLAHLPRRLQPALRLLFQGLTLEEVSARTGLSRHGVALQRDSARLIHQDLTRSA